MISRMILFGLGLVTCKLLLEEELGLASAVTGLAVAFAFCPEVLAFAYRPKAPAHDSEASPTP